MFYTLQNYTNYFLLLLAMSPLSCHQSDFEPPPIIWQGNLISFGDNSSAQLCAGTLDRDDKFLEILYSELELPPEEIVYYRLSSESYERSPCPHFSQGCYWDGEVYTRFIPHRHELVHAALYSSGIEPHPFLDEGFAELFSDSDLQPNEQSVVLGLSYTGKRSEFPNELRWRAGHFASFLASEFQTGSLVALFEQTNAGDNYEDVASAFEEVLGVPLETILSQYEDYPECSSRGFTKKYIECTEPILACEDQLCSFSTRLDCNEPDVVGPRADFVWSGRTLEVENDAELEISLMSESGDPRLIFGRCESDCNSELHVEVSQNSSRVVNVAPGRYYVRPYTTLHEPDVIDVEIRRL